MPLVRKTQGTSATAPHDAAAVFHALVNGNDDERWAAARAAAGLPDGQSALGAALACEHNARVREAIFTGLVRIATPDSVEAVLSCLRSDDAPLRTGALDALRAMAGVVWPYVPQLLRDRDPDVRVLACELARNAANDDATGVLCKLLEVEPEPNVCASAVEVLAEVGTAAALPVLARCAERFRGITFLEFSIQITIDRIRTQSSQRG